MKTLTVAVKHPNGIAKRGRPPKYRNHDEKEQSSVTRQINNVLDYWPEAEIEVVVHSAAIEFMMTEKSVAKEAILETMKKGVIYAVCRNTMKRKSVSEDEIITGAVFVPVGIAEIVLKQENGFAYIKAGY